MKGLKGLCLALLALAALSGCRSANTVKPLTPKRKIAPSVVRIEFTHKVSGPMELILDGVRVPVDALKKKRSKPGALVITGLAVGKHKYFIGSPRDAFSPDQGEFEVVASKGTFLVLFAQHFDAVLYGKPEPLPKPEGIPGVKAALDL